MRECTWWAWVCQLLNKCQLLLHPVTHIPVPLSPCLRCSSCYTELELLQAWLSIPIAPQGRNRALIYLKIPENSAGHYRTWQSMLNICHLDWMQWLRQSSSWWLFTISSTRKIISNNWLQMTRWSRPGSLYCLGWVEFPQNPFCGGEPLLQRKWKQ